MKLPFKWSADMLETARSLDARGVEGLVTFVLDKGEPRYCCVECGASCPDGSCPNGDDDEWLEQTWPDLYALPDLKSRDNAGRLLGLIEDAGYAYTATWLPPSKEHALGGHLVSAGGLPMQRGGSISHAAGKALLLLPTKDTR